MLQEEYIKIYPYFSKTEARFKLIFDNSSIYSLH